jgi:hypothetical protein
VHDQPAAALDQERRRERRRDVLRAHASGEHVVPDRERPRPERRAEELVLAAVEIFVAAPRVVDEDVEPPTLGTDPFDDTARLVVVTMVAANRDRLAPESLRVFGRGLERPGQRNRGRVSARGPPREVDRRSGLRQPENDALPDAASGAGHEGDAAGEGHAPHQKLAATTT